MLKNVHLQALLSILLTYLYLIHYKWEGQPRNLIISLHNTRLTTLASAIMQHRLQNAATTWPTSCIICPHDGSANDNKGGFNLRLLDSSNNWSRGIPQATFHRNFDGSS